MLPDLIGRAMVDRIAVLVTYDGSSKLLGVPKIQVSSGQNMAEVVHKLLVDWGISDRVAAMSFDTTSSNTGDKSGACFLLQQRLNSKPVMLACRHHMYEIVLRSIFELKVAPSKAPDVPFFQRFAKAWPDINQTNFQSGLEDESIRMVITNDECEDIKSFCFVKLTEKQPRSDYREFLKLVLVFLGEDAGDFRAPGPTSNARWMAKAIYCLKMFLFRNEYKLTPREVNSLRDVCLFLVKIYVKAWFGSTNAISAPNQDYNFVLDSASYSQFDSTVSKEILRKLGNHLWYFAVDTIALAFFDPTVSVEEKVKMIQRLQFSEPIVKLQNGRKLDDPKILLNHSLSDFVSKHTYNFFSNFGLSSEFLKYHPSTWESNDDYQKGVAICRNIPVVNDTAERGVKFIKDYNKFLTNNEEEMQLILQTVEEYRKKYKSFNKSALI